jgi:L-threonylcarbamoyladenylate synthase
MIDITTTEIADTVDRAARIIRSGGVLVYPTETLYALGGSGLCQDAALRVIGMKSRPLIKPLPLLIGSIDQLGLVTPFRSRTLERLAARFWPGPLSILVPVGRSLPPQVSDSAGRTSVRVSSHPVAQALALAAGCPLIATSANKSGGPPAARPGELDRELSVQADLVVLGEPWPSGGPPSTVVELISGGLLRIVRAGAVTAKGLAEAGFSVESKP